MSSFAPMGPSGADAGHGPRSPVVPDGPAIEAALHRFAAWLGEVGHDSYDQYDLWATRYGLWSRRLFYRWGKPAAPLILPLVLVDWLAPGTRRWICPQHRYPSADAHYLMGFLLLHQASGAPQHLDAAVELAEALIRSAIPGFSGPCWGYPFDWQSKVGLCPRNTPLVTVVPYAFDAFLDLYAITGIESYRETAQGIASFVANDIPDNPARRGRAAGYSPSSRSKVINASAYRAACLTRASAVFSAPQYRHIAEDNILFVLDQQQADGSWLYAADDDRETFIDHMHTCFVLKGLYRAYQVLKDEEILRAVKRGYQYYRESLFYPNGLPRPFAKAETRQFRVAELYDYAEALNLALLLLPDLDTSALADRLASSLLEHWQTPAGYFTTRVSTHGIRNTVPYHRWGQAPAWHSLALYNLNLVVGHRHVWHLRSV